MSHRSTMDMKSSTGLRREWCSRASAAGWSAPTDWYVPAVDAVCDAIASECDVWAAAERLGRSRAAAGVPLAETLVDVDELAQLSPAGYGGPLRRSVSLGWADEITAPPSSVIDPLTGLTTPEYLQVRLAEVYRAAEVLGQPVSAGSALVVIRLDPYSTPGWQRTLPMILVADGLRQVFDAGQTLSVLSESVAVVLCAREIMLARRVGLLCSLVARQIELDPQLEVAAPTAWIEALPTGYTAALQLVAELAR